MTPHDELLDNVAAYALGLLSPAEAESVARHLQTCEQCREEYRLLRPAVTAVAYSAQSPSDASPLLKARVMRHVRAEAARHVRPPVWAAYAIAAACLAIAIITGLADLSLNGQLNRERAQAAAQAQREGAQAQRERAQAAAQAQTIADFTAPDSQRHRFARGEIVTHGTHLYIAMHDLPTPPRGRVYQAWTLPKGSKIVVPSVTFEPAKSGIAVVRLPEAATGVAAVAVSVEPEGGSKQPTTKPIAVVPI